MTTSPPRDQVESALADLIKESLERGETAHVPGLGTFAIRHENSSIQTSDDGELVMTPPRNEITFTPDR